jgi:hypothetical protein
MVVFLGKGYALWRGVVGPCPGCPEGGEGGKEVVLCPLSPVFPGKRVGNPYICCVAPGP